MKKIYSLILLFGLLVPVLSLMAQDCNDLFFSEYIEGSGNNKGMEIYNPTNEIVVLDKYYVARYSNGGLDYTSGGITQLVGFLQPYSTHLIVNGQTTTSGTSPACDPALQAMAQQLDHGYPAPTYMNGNDAIALFFDPVGSGSVTDFVVVDLFGIIGGGMQSSDVGWANFTNQYAYKNIYNGDVITGQDSVYIQNYIVPETYYWLPWSANHSLFRKPSVTQGVKTNPATEFVITLEWDTVPGGNNAWDHLGEHTCDCTPAAAIGAIKADPQLSVYPNPANSRLFIRSEKPFSEVILMDAAGRVMLSKNYPAGELIQNINLAETLPGIYFIRVMLEEGTVVRKVVIR